jgi:hypothetical protein
MVESVNKKGYLHSDQMNDSYRREASTLEDLEQAGIKRAL